LRSPQFGSRFFGQARHQVSDFFFYKFDKPSPMKLRNIYLAMLFAVVAGCTILKQEDPESKVRAFIASFAQSLSGTDQEILGLFDTQQSQEAILSAVRVLQNQTEYGIQCQLYSDQASITFEETGVRVIIPVSISGSAGELVSSADNYLTFILSPKKDAFVITKLEGDEFYNAYTSVKYELAEAASEAEVHEHILTYGKIVEFLQEKYDTVVWVANYEGTPYFYVVNGSWDADQGGVFLMGLVDETGKEIIPVQYDMVGTIGFDWPGMLEVRDNNGVGLFSLEKGEVVQPGYEWIVPYEITNAFAIVKTDSAYGWLDKTYNYHDDFPSESAAAFIASHDFLPTGREFSSQTTTMCEIPSEEYYGSGRIIFPAYLTSTGLFQEVEYDFTMYANTWRANTEMISADHQFFDSVLEGVSMLMTSISKRYLDGREAFYTSNEVSFVSNDGTLVGTSASLASSDITINRIDSTLIEIVTTNSADGPEFYEESSDETEIDIPQYMYFRLEETGPEQLGSSRMFNFTEFVKLDSSYLTGNFTYIERETFNTSSRTFLCDTTLIRMRNEILAEYGYIFPDERTTEAFKFNNWYNPRYQAVAQFEDNLNDIDRHNLKFLEKILGPVPEPESI
jgi:hypothetical protein